jgi:biopolymer transport protein TolQ
MQTVEPQATSSGGILGLFPHTPEALSMFLVLILFSLLSWTIIIRKWLTFIKIERQSREFVGYFRNSARLSEVNALCEHYHETPLSGLFSAAYQELNLQLQAIQGKNNPDNPTSTTGGSQAAVLNERHLGAIHRSLQRASVAELSVLERNMSWLATTGSVTPFIGLLGTVIGIIKAFEGLGLEKTASIQAVAPGIAEALVATAAGLFAAIPAVIGYNQFLNRIKGAAAEMDDFTAELLNLFERSFS